MECYFRLNRHDKWHKIEGDYSWHFVIGILLNNTDLDGLDVRFIEQR